MKLTRVGLLSLVCVGAAFAFGVAANAALDLVMPPAAKKAETVAVKPAKPAEQPATYTLVSATSTPADFAPIKVKTIPMVYREDAIADLAAERPANVPLPRPRPATAPMALASTGDAVGSIAHQPGTMAIAAATRKGEPDDGEVLGTAGIERMKTALALTAEQEEYWPAIAAELRALGKAMKANAKHNGGKLSVDQDTIQRLYWAAAPLITRLSYEQKMKAKQMARLMGLNQVAEAL
jgi:hypothetical protein